MSDFSRRSTLSARISGAGPVGRGDGLDRAAGRYRGHHPARLRRGCLKRWLMAQVAGSMELGVENHTILLLAGGQGAGQDLVAAEPRAARVADYLSRAMSIRIARVSRR